MTRSQADATDTPRRKYAPRMAPQQRREQLLDAAFEVTGRVGLHNLSMESVAAEAGVGKPVLYTIFDTRTDLVAALLRREHERAIAQVLETMPTDLSELGPAASYTGTVGAFVDAVLENPTRWRLILTSVENAPSEYHGLLKLSRGAVFARAEELARAGIALEPKLEGLDPVLLAHTMMSFAEMLGRLAVSDPETYTRERLSSFAVALAQSVGR
ncbi:TetR/AcrR family transcriptional regulator [Rhodococcus sp. IC4_135]|uniref:TetR/AcrR family transcriptional regulator n=1 Tax=unclassified Rhodococcus (in: high G+C Gram-positive bacteria) TaxID=192944 RepID=UPI001421E05F|nr:TetR/AcrR family transcriptional regulator [Rhodococcus sp. P-2]NHP16362.1 TetR/AcrR family transcriptional regulator [Rhodococcus sp. IC4_135]QQM19470.1 TetR/AcrR family transcriptional regulator [Rhodococcus sp. P-2]